MKPNHIVIALCMAVLLAPGAVAATDASSSHPCSGARDFDCTHIDCNQLYCVLLHCPVYLGHSGHTYPLSGCTPA